MNTYLDVLCYRSKTLTDGTSPILIRLTRNGKRKYVSLGLSIDPKFWDFNKNVPKRNCPDKAAITSIIEKKSALYRDMITELKVEGKEYSLETLVQRVEEPVKKQTFGSYLQEYIESLQAEKRFGNAVTFKGLKSSVLKYRKSLDFYFTDIDAQWLRGYEMSLRANGNNENTILRTVLKQTTFSQSLTDVSTKQRFRKGTASLKLQKQPTGH